VRFDILTLHPDMCTAPLDSSIIGRARRQGLIEVGVHDLRDWAEGKHRQADDTPYGGGAGMVMRVDVVDRGIQAVSGSKAHVLLMDPAGTPFKQADAHRLASQEQLVLVCGHYEGIDARIRDHVVDEVFSVGDFVLTGGELPAMVIIDAVARLLPEVLGNPESSQSESFSAGLLEAPQYTRPRKYRDWSVPEVLLSGHHAEIEAWREEAARELTQAVRPDLIAEHDDSES
jgi:tRNA (guanine37-N1)-methyltransferase